MFLPKALALPVVAFALVSASLPVDYSFPAVEPEQPELLHVAYPMVHRVDCKEGRGTAFRVGLRQFASVAHVVSLSLCKIEGQPITVTEKDGENDFALVDADIPRPGGLKVNCGGFHPGEWYWAVGHARGEAVQTAVALWATIYKDDDGLRIFAGHHSVIPGMSGGAVFNAAGEVVGTVNKYNPIMGLSFSRELKDTSICRSVG